MTNNDKVRHLLNILDAVSEMLADADMSQNGALLTIEKAADTLLRKVRSDERKYKRMVRESKHKVGKFSCEKESKKTRMP